MYQYILLLLTLVLLLGGCGSEIADSLTITGSTSVTPFMEQLAEEYQQQHPVTINVQGLGSSAGIRAAIDGVAELGMSSRDLKPDEQQVLDETVIARDALAVIVHPNNPVGSLTREQIQRIFSGSIQSWDQVGGPPRPIVVVSREAGSGTFSAFEELVMKGAPLTTQALRQGSNGAVRQIVGDDPDAIGYISLGIVDQTVKALQIDGVQPSAENVESGQYKLVRPFLIVWRKGAQLTPLARNFMAFVMSPQGQDELVRAGLVRGKAP